MRRANEGTSTAQPVAPAGPAVDPDGGAAPGAARRTGARLTGLLGSLGRAARSAAAALPSRGTAAQVPGVPTQRGSADPVTAPARRRGFRLEATIQVKILALVAVVGVAGLGTGIAAVTAMLELAGQTQVLADSQRDIASPVARIRENLQEASGIVAQIAAAGTPGLQAPWLARQTLNDEALATDIAAVEAAGGAELDGWTEFVGAYGQWLKVRDAALVPAAQTDTATYVRVLGLQAEPLTLKYSAALDAVLADVTARAEVTAQDSATRAAQAVRVVIGVIAVAVLGLMVFGVVTARSIRRSVARVEVSLGAMARGDLTVDPGVESRDEIGRMAAELRAAQSALRKALSGVAERSGRLAVTAGELYAAAEEVGERSAESNLSTELVAAAADQVSATVQSLATDADDVSGSILEIAHSAEAAALVAEEAVEASRGAATTVSELGESAAQIGTVVRAITSIAEQTNLLALNATIEAARAGEAGRGFAVVAGEVKELARESARAAEDIAARIASNQVQTGSAVDVITRITEVIGRISSYQTSISGAVEQQSATTKHMSESVGEVATGSADIAAAISGIATTSETANAVVARMVEQVAQVAQMSDELRDQVAGFRF